MAELTRMQFLRGDLKGDKIPFRPPWAIPENYFVDFCTRCDKCIEACFDELIIKGQGGYPQMNFNRGGCDFCEQCLNVCEAGALKKIPFSGTFLAKNKSANKKSANNNNSSNRESNRDSNKEALSESASGSFLPPWHIKASIDLNKCLSMNATICRSCGESCDDEAIKFILELGGIAEPVLNTETCTGCGACYSVCPVQAVKLKTIIIKEAVA